MQSVQKQMLVEEEILQFNGTVNLIQGDTWKAAIFTTHKDICLNYVGAPRFFNISDG